MITAIPLGHRLTAVLDTGIHPASLAPINPDSTCGSCLGRITQDNGRTKCKLAGAGAGSCEQAAPDDGEETARSRFKRGGPNLPAQTPACTLFTPIPSEQP